MAMRMNHTLGRAGKVLTIALPVLGVASLSVFVVLPSKSEARPHEAHTIDELAARSMVVALELEHLGLTPEVLAAAGLGSQQASQLVAVLSLDSGFGIDRYRAARVACVGAERDLDALVSRVRRGLEPSAGMASARAHARACLRAREAAESAVFDLARGLMTEHQASALATIRQNVANGVALPHAAAPLTAAERLRLRDALTARAESERTGFPLDPSTSAFLSSIESLPEVMTASFGLDGAHFVQAAFDAALRDLDN